MLCRDYMPIEVDHANVERCFPGHTSSSRYGAGQYCRGIIDSHGHHVLVILDTVVQVVRRKEDLPA
jgi:hypothetical protein